MSLKLREYFVQSTIDTLAKGRTLNHQGTRGQRVSCYDKSHLKRATVREHLPQCARIF